MDYKPLLNLWLERKLDAIEKEMNDKLSKVGDAEVHDRITNIEESLFEALEEVNTEFSDKYPSGIIDVDTMRKEQLTVLFTDSYFTSELEERSKIRLDYDFKVQAVYDVLEEVKAHLALTTTRDEVIQVLKDYGIVKGKNNKLV